MLAWRQRILQSSYQRLARVPLDFADEILPAEVSAAERFGEEAEALRPEPEEVDEMDCGAACLAMVCRWYGRPANLVHQGRRPHQHAGDLAQRESSCSNAAASSSRAPTTS